MMTTLRYRNGSSVTIRDVDWIGDAALDDLGLRDVRDDCSELVAVNGRGDETIVMAVSLYAAQSEVEEDKEAYDDGTGFGPLERLWEHFCDAADVTEFEVTLPDGAADVCRQQMVLAGILGHEG
jgi:hypothetical protein